MAGRERLGIGIDVGGTKILAGTISPDGKVIAEARVPSPEDATGLAEALGVAVGELCAAVGNDVGDIVALGLALPGLVEPSGVLRAAPNLGAADVGIELTTSYGGPLLELLARAGARVDPHAVVYDNDATCAAYGEAVVGAAEGDGDVLVVSFGTGIGAGIVSNGKVLRGAHGFAGEIGHMIIDPDGPPCPCGRRGCWERYASGAGLAELAGGSARGGGALSEATPSASQRATIRGEDVVEAARRGEAGALLVVSEFARYVALGLSNAVELLDPARIVLGGGLMQASDVLFEPITLAYVAMNRPAQQRGHADLVLATLGEDAAMVGAGLLGLEQLEAPSS